MVPLVALVTLVFTLTSDLDLVLLALLGAVYIAQLLPPLLFSLMGDNLANRWGAPRPGFWDLAVVRYLIVAGLTLRAVFPSSGPLGDVNTGVVALLANTSVVVAVSLAIRTSKIGGEPWRRVS